MFVYSGYRLSHRCERFRHDLLWVALLFKQIVHRRFVTLKRRANDVLMAECQEDRESIPKERIFMTWFLGLTIDFAEREELVFMRMFGATTLFCRGNKFVMTSCWQGVHLPQSCLRALERLTESEQSNQFKIVKGMCVCFFQISICYRISKIRWDCGFGFAVWWCSFGMCRLNCAQTVSALISRLGLWKCGMMQAAKHTQAQVLSSCPDRQIAAWCRHPFAALAAISWITPE